MKNEDIIAAARARLASAIDGDKDNREEALDDLRNLAGDQWDEDVRAAREDEGKPIITVNRLAQFVRQVTGDIRKLNPAISVMPADGAATDETAEIIEGLVRHIEYRSDASSVYEGAAESAAQCGMGAFRIRAEYESDDSFDQELLIERIHNPFSVYWDPAAREANREDAMFCFITEQMTKDDFEEAYPDADGTDADHDGTTDGLEHWHDSGSVIVAEYFWKEPTDVKLGLLRDGTVVEKPKAIMDVVKTRTVTRYKVMWAKVSGTEVLEGPTEIPSRHIPVVAVMGEELHVGTEVKRTSVIRYAKDPQKLYNYWSSAQTELIALQPKAPYLLTADQVEGYQEMWGVANDANRPYLVYNADPNAPPPMRATPPIPSAGMMQEVQKAVEDMKATTGIYDAGLGQRSNEQSGVAIRQRQMESDVSTSIYTDNLAKAISHCGRIIVDMIPKIYDTNRVVRIVGDDDQEKMVEVNGMSYSLDAMGAVGAEPVNPLNIGKYDVRVSVGPNYSTRRQETQEGMMQFVQAFPQAGAVAGDLIAKAMDWPDADKLAERLRKTLPPGMIDPEDMSPEEQQQMQAGAMQQQQAAQQQAQAQEAEFRKTVAEATEAEHDAEKARFETLLKQLELVAAQLAPMMPQQAAPAPQSAPQGYSPY